MRIPSNAQEREDFYLETLQKCLVSKEERRADYHTLRAYYLFGAGPEEPPAYFNKINPHLDQLSSFLYSADTTRFSIQLGASVNNIELQCRSRVFASLELVFGVQHHLFKISG